MSDEILNRLTEAMVSRDSRVEPLRILLRQPEYRSLVQAIQDRDRYIVARPAEMHGTVLLGGVPVTAARWISRPFEASPRISQGLTLPDLDPLDLLEGEAVLFYRREPPAYTTDVRWPRATSTENQILWKRLISTDNCYPSALPRATLARWAALEALSHRVKARGHFPWDPSLHGVLTTVGRFGSSDWAGGQSPLDIRLLFGRVDGSRVWIDGQTVGALEEVVRQRVGDPDLYAVGPSAPGEPWEVWPGSPESSLPAVLGSGPCRVSAWVDVLDRGWSQLDEDDGSEEDEWAI